MSRNTSSFFKRLFGGDPMVGDHLTSDQGIKYRIKDKIGEGGMGVVYRALDPNDQEVAVKLTTLDQAIKRFRLETVMQKLLGKHPNLPELIDWGLDDSQIKFCVMEYIPGESLDNVIMKRESWFYERTLFYTVEVAILLLTGLNHAHNKKIIHRDIKPSNIIVSRSSDGALQLKLMDFGIAKTLEKSFLSFLHKNITFDEKTLTLPGQPLGTLGYAPREQIDGTNPKETVDIFACGITLLELLVARSILPSKTISDYITKLDSFVFEPLEMPGENVYVVNRLNHILKKALEREPRSRYRRAGKMLKDLLPLRRELLKNR